ncbi:MAG: hypothetical protein ACD_38C00171G0004 [uncultured bacterium]|uniref:Uncharacterized protein n=1 Tax=Candidatus Daviesbacteria bacterium GW2011_GWC2_40_12 TaxID=1618431 RepID=A0A0G0QPK7_9BACT|nr:MAG: hypothetical protein ACD_38C00171G0004 [uncultured bacterium]KKQ85813.1 MAG: hypothetical protein UT04_C0001G0025 [Candidatus Daviesbacteria bacterium GW2011_GWF2_38_7]KKR16860.1 MAG: hypothetical protein UT45_C0004G0191 [Candidatus Daviesbacteria bacterium GW2011_GWA2_39_33]KKR42359.1 MAG: hypothetical protein UT77_C0002G0012 [Candidatus Daviesbacteria bacterium GW2011_GWC2_40_12]OGE22275.1 MAG: hypothetical protein A2778_00290 [Candidatus Daviesbacteria bacterium RIFCSPHIGHO2_01_FULL_
MDFIKRHWKKLLLICVSPFVLIFFIFGISQFAPEKPPADFLIVRNMFDLNQTIAFSQFRSCQGHRSMSQSTKEPDSSMAHYIMTNAKFKTESQGQVKVFAPFDGYITNSLNFQGFSFVPKSSRLPWWPFNQFRINLAHVKALPQYNGTVAVKAGDLVGFDDPNEFYPDATNISLDVRIGVMALPPENKANNGEPLKNMYSMFLYMSDEVFAEYKAAIPGLESREDFIIPLSYRAANPCKFQGNGPYFDYSQIDFQDPKYSGYVYMGTYDRMKNAGKKEQNTN